MCVRVRVWVCVRACAWSVCEVCVCGCVHFWAKEQHLLCFRAKQSLSQGSVPYSAHTYSQPPFFKGDCHISCCVWGCGGRSWNSLPLKSDQSVQYVSNKDPNWENRCCVCCVVCCVCCVFACVCVLLPFFYYLFFLILTLSTHCRALTTQRERSRVSMFGTHQHMATGFLLSPQGDQTD